MRKDKIMPEFQITLAGARVSAGLVQEEVAKIMGVSKQTIVNWEKGKTSPDITQARRLSEIYKIPLDYISLPA